MLESVHRIGSRIRNSSLLVRQRWLWRYVEPLWNAVFARMAQHRGYLAQVNEDYFYLTYEYGSRYDRQDQRVYETIFYQAFVDRIKSGMTVFDIGAHVGFFTLAAAKRVGATGCVYAFEPSPDSASILRQHVRLNHWQHCVRVVEAVVGDTDQPVSFYVHGASMAASLGRKNVEELNPERPASIGEILVTSITLDQFCTQHDLKPDIVKIDVEGAELLVLRGAKEILLTKKPIILCEIHPQHMESCSTSKAELDAFLETVHYCSEAIDEPNPMGIFHSVLQRCESSMSVQGIL